VWNCINGFKLGVVNLTRVFFSVSLFIQRNIQCTFPVEILNMNSLHQNFCDDFVFFLKMNMCSDLLNML
jgi:hypothetical protein